MSTQISPISPNITPVYSPEATYAKGVCVLYNNQYWRCTEPIATPEAWTSSHWTPLPDVVSDLKNLLKTAVSNPSDVKLSAAAIKSYLVALYSAIQSL